MTKLLKIFLPPFIGFAVFFLAVRYSTLYFTLRIDQMGEGTLSSFMAFYKFLLPLLLTDAVLTQLLVVIPVWRFGHGTNAGLKISILFDLIVVCLLFASGIAYAIWDRADGVSNLVKLIAFMTSVQLVYWIINLSTLLLLEEHPEPEIKEAEPEL